MSVSLEQLIADRVGRLNWIVLAAMVALSLAAWSLKFSLGVAAGGLLATANFMILARTLKRQFQTGHTPSIGGVLGRYYLRFIVTGLIILVLIKFDIVGPIGLLIGLSVVVLNLTLTGLIVAWRSRPKEAL